MTSKGKKGSELAGGKLLSGALYVATFLIILAFFAQTFAPILAP